MHSLNIYINHLHFLICVRLQKAATVTESRIVNQYPDWQLLDLLHQVITGFFL